MKKIFKTNDVGFLEEFLYHFTRDELRELAKELDIPRGRNKNDTITNIRWSDKVQQFCKFTTITIDVDIPKKQQKYNYAFTTKVAKNICKICGEIISEKWSEGGVGAVCEKCYPIRDKFDLIEMGIIKDIDPVKRTFKVKIDETWYNACGPCGNWSYVQ